MFTDKLSSAYFLLPNYHCPMICTECVYVVTSNLQALRAMLVLPLERLSEAGCRTISHTPLPLLLGGPWVRWGRPTCSSPLVDSPTVRTFSKMVKKPQWSWPDHLAHFQSLLLCLPVKHFGHPPGGLLLEQQILLKSGVNHFSRLIMSLSNFSHRSFSTSGHYWQWKPSQWDFSDQLPPPPVLLLRLLIITYSCNSYQGLVMVHLLDNFLIFLHFFWLWQAISWNHYDRGWEGVRAETKYNHKTSPPSIALSIKIFWAFSKHTSYIF